MPSVTIFSRDIGVGSFLISVIYFQFCIQGFDPGDFALEEQLSGAKVRQLEPQLCTKQKSM